MKKIRRLTAMLLVCVMALCMLTACTEGDVNDFFNGLGSSLSETANGIVTAVGETAKSAADETFQGVASNVNAYGNSNEEAFRQEVFKLVNEEREKAGLKPLTMNNSKLTEAAQIRAKEIATKYYPAHYRPNGDKCFTVLQEVGLTAKTDYNYAGENIASGWVTPKTVMTAWMNSKGHRANILNEKYTQIGIGYYFEAGSASGSYCYWTQMFLG